MKKHCLQQVSSWQPACLHSAPKPQIILFRPPSRNSYYQNVSSYTNITLGMADRERKEQEAWDREKKRRGKEYESDKQERRDRERWERQEEKKRTEENRHHKKDKKRKNDSDFERHRKWKFDPSQSGGEGD